MMPKTILAVGAVFTLATMAGATDVCSDGFSNGPRADLHGSTGGVGWAGPWQDTGSSMATSVGGPGLTYPGLPTSPGAATTPSGGSFDAARYYRPMPAYSAPEGRVYISFLLRQDAGFGSYAGLSFGTYPRAVQVGTPLGYYSYGFMVGDGLIVDSNIPVQQGQTALLVMRVQLNATSTTYRLYVNPNLSAGEPGYGNAEFTVQNFVALPTFLYLNNDGGYTTDEIRVATRWGEVVGAPACRVDWDHNLRVEPADVAAFVNTWFADLGGGTLAGDFDSNGSVQPADIAAFVNAWFAALTTAC